MATLEELDKMAGIPSLTSEEVDMKPQSPGFSSTDDPVRQLPPEHYEAPAAVQDEPRSAPAAEEKIVDATVANEVLAKNTPDDPAPKSEARSKALSASHEAKLIKLFGDGKRFVVADPAGFKLTGNTFISSLGNKGSAGYVLIEVDPATQQPITDDDGKEVKRLLGVTALRLIQERFNALDPAGLPASAVVKKRTPKETPAA